MHQRRGMAAGKKSTSAVPTEVMQVKENITPLISEPQLLATPSDSVSDKLRSAAAGLYSLSTQLHKGKLQRLFTSKDYDPEQIFSQIDSYNSSVLAKVDEKIDALLEKGGAAQLGDTKDDLQASEEKTEETTVKARRQLYEARKKLRAQEEDAELDELTAAYGKKAKRKKSGAGAVDEEERLLRDLEEAYKDEDVSSDEPEDAPLGLGGKKRKGAKQPTAKKEEGDEGEEIGMDDDVEDMEGDEEEEEDEEDEEDEEMMAEMREDMKAMEELYGPGMFGGSGGDFGKFEEEEKYGDDAVKEEQKLKRAAKAVRDKQLWKGLADGEEGEGEGEEEGDVALSSDEEEVFLDEEKEAAEAAEAMEEGLTPFQARQKKLQAKIQKFEDKLVEDKHWSMMGETMASKRPKNALLEEVLEFDHTQRAKPLVSAEMTASLEDRLKKRIQEDRFDDVERKARKSSAMDLTIEHKSEIDLHAKSKVGLADLYEKEWLDKHRKSLEEAGETSRTLTEEEKEELKCIQMWRALSSSLDQLSNFYFTPKPQPSDELAIRATQKSAIAIEEATPTAVANQQLLAPQDVYAPSMGKYADKGKEELSTKERKRLRRAKKEAGKKTKKRKDVQQQAKEQKRSAIKKARKDVKEKATA